MRRVCSGAGTVYDVPTFAGAGALGSPTYWPCHVPSFTRPSGFCMMNTRPTTGSPLMIV
jgi:hypothetical protein